MRPKDRSGTSSEWRRTGGARWPVPGLRGLASAGSECGLPPPPNRPDERSDLLPRNVPGRQPPVRPGRGAADGAVPGHRGGGRDPAARSRRSSHWSGPTRPGPRATSICWRRPSASRSATSSSTSRSRPGSTTGLMAIFFFVVGLEIKRELVVGRADRSRGPRRCRPSPRLGGMVVPAAIYLAFNCGRRGRGRLGHPDGHRHRLRGRGRLRCSAPGCPARCKVFLLTLAIVDDIGAIAGDRHLLHRRSSPSAGVRSPSA